MSSWAEIEAAEPDFAKKVRGVFDAHKHKTMATLRRDGSPRISGIEMEFSNREVFVGMMPASVKFGDLQRDARVAFHSASEDPPADDPASWTGDAKIAGRAIEVPEKEFKKFRIDITEVVLIRVGRPADHLVVESWHPGRGLIRRERR
ncbi:MAG TPA: pyridoxamine 5'-phosphate oxidase [Candidatus Eisenbacteria bacterium]|nr:pyridoxamine 5'-phosphate oxidase [Candidatus Eisenbacteria bacterium]